MVVVMVVEADTAGQVSRPGDAASQQGLVYTGLSSTLTPLIVSHQELSSDNNPSDPL